MPQQLKGRAVLITVQHGFNEVFEYLKGLEYAYLLIGGYEQGETQIGEDKKHCHIYIDFGKQKGLTKIYKYVQQFGSFDVMHHHDSDFAVNYCTKLQKVEKDGKVINVKEAFDNQEKIFEDGVYELVAFGKGARSDLKKKLDAYNSIDDFILNEPELNAKYRGGIRDYYRVKNANARVSAMLDFMDGTKKIFVEYHTGNSNAGKTYSAAKIGKQYLEEGRLIALVTFDNSGFAHIEGTEDAEIVIINEFRDKKVQFDDFLQYLENTKAYNIKGGDMLFPKLKKLIITSVIPPEELYAHEYKAADQIKKRINRIIEHELVYGKYCQTEREFGVYLEDCAL